MTSQTDRLRVMRLHRDAAPPRRASGLAAGMDLHIHRVIEDDGDRVTFGTGIAVALPRHHCGRIVPRSSAFKAGWILDGTIDEDYRGEIILVAWRLRYVPTPAVGASIAQLLVVPVAAPAVVEVDSLDSTARGAGGFGSTGRTGGGRP